MPTSKTKKDIPIGGGAKKVLYTLNTARKMGIRRAGKALRSNNACKACGLGMGGQKGGMVNEANEFPSVCNKSVQAQSSDIQAAIPHEIFKHSLKDLQELTEREMDRLGRLDTPLFKQKGADHYEPVSWDFALDYAAEQFKDTAPDQSFFYSSGRSSNEAGFILQLLARLYGTNNVNNCSYYCHQATSEGLSSSIGTGTATVEFEDLSGADLIFVIGANPSSNHPRFIHALKKCRDRGGEVIVINPAKEPGLIKFAIPKSPSSLLKGGDEIASLYIQPKIGSDILLMKGIAKALIDSKECANNFIEKYATQFETYKKDINQTIWDEVTKSTGLGQKKIEKIASIYAASKNAIFAWGMGITHHLHGVDNVSSIVNLCLLRGMVGRPHAGLLPLRGHSNVQGIGTIGVKPVLPAQIFELMEKTLGVSLPQQAGLDTMACLKKADEGEMSAALLMGGNLFGATPNTQFAQRALNKIGFKLYLTTTLNRGHVVGMEDGEAIILPVRARDEETQATTQESMFNYVRLSDGGISRLQTIKSETEILCHLANTILPNKPIDFDQFLSHQNIREAIAKIIPGMEKLQNIDVAKKEFHVRNRLMHKPKFNTTSGKASFIKIATPTIKYPFNHNKTALLSTVRSEGQFNTIIYEEKDSYRGANTRWCVFLNEKDMRRWGIKTRQAITISSQTGKMEKVAALPFDLPEGNAMAYFPEANCLAQTEVDERSKTPAFKSIPIEIQI